MTDAFWARRNMRRAVQLHLRGFTLGMVEYRAVQGALKNSLKKVFVG
jgi:hypothetical protein